MRRNRPPSVAFDGAKFLRPGEEWRPDEVRSVLNGVLNADLDHSGRRVQQRKSGKGLKRITRWEPSVESGTLSSARSDEDACRFVLRLAMKPPEARERLIREAAEALHVLRKLARQIARDTRVLRLTDEERKVLNGLLSRQPMLEVEPGAEMYRTKTGIPLTLRARNRPRSPFTANLYRVAYYLVSLRESGAGLRLRVCRAPVRPQGLASKRTCGRFFVESTQGQPARYCSRAYQENAYRRREEEKLRVPPGESAR
jgi:hypothetical protein